MRVIIKPMGMIVIAVLLGGAFAAVALRKSGGTEVPLEAKGNLVTQTKWKFYTEKGAVGNMSVIREQIKGKLLGGMQIRTDQPGPQPWNAGVSNALGVPFKMGDKLRIRFWGRSATGSQITVIVQRNVPGFPDCFKKTVTLTPEWKEYQYDFIATTMERWESMIAIHGGFKQGSLDLAGIELGRL